MKRAAALLASVALALAIPSLAGAAPPLAAPHLDVVLRPAETGGPVLIVHGAVPSSTPLPYTIRLPLPQGAQITWAGEITGKGASADIQRTPNIVAGSGGQVAEITLQQQREGQYEAKWVPAALEGSAYVSTLPWVQSAPADSVQFEAQFPPNADQITLTPTQQGPPQFNEQGASLYLLPPSRLRVGEPFTLTARYAITASGTPAGQPVAAVPAKQGSTAVIVVVGVLLALAIVALIAALAMSRARASRGSGE